MNPTWIDNILKSGMAHQQAGRLLEAQQAYEQILAAQPNHVVALHMLGMLWGQSGFSARAVEVIQRVVQLLPNRAEAHNNLGNCLRDCGRVDEALVHFIKAVELDDRYPGAYRNMANVYMEQGRHDQAMECFRRALLLEPKAAEIHSNFLYMLHFRNDYDSGKLLAEHLKWSDQHERPLAGLRQRHGNDATPDRPLKIGYVSADFCNHPVGRFLLPLFAHHDRENFSIHCYSHSTRMPDATSQRLQSFGFAWRVVTGLSDRQLADQIRKDGIDILVDLGQHSGQNRLLAFAYKPAPVQVSWLGYPGTTGMKSMEYRLTDPYLDPPGQGDENYTERSIHLPHCFWCYEPLDLGTPVGPLPAGERGLVTFGCMNRFSKLTPATLKLWRQILIAVPHSRLLIHSNIGDHLDDVRRAFAKDGIASRRLEFVERKPASEYLRQFHRMDICLDPFPHGGGTVTCDSLWMGVPVITLSGCTAVGRGGASLLSNVGLPQLIAQTKEQYFQVAVGLAGGLTQLAQMRATIRQRMQASPLMDSKRFAGDMEAAYRQMWKNWCSTR